MRHCLQSALAKAGLLEPRYNIVSRNISIKLQYAPGDAGHAFAGKVRNPLMSGKKQLATPLLDIT